MRRGVRLLLDPCLLERIQCDSASLSYLLRIHLEEIALGKRIATYYQMTNWGRHINADH